MKKKRIAINFGGGYVPGLNAVVTGVVRAAHEAGWDVVGIRDGYDGLLFPQRYPEGGLVSLEPPIMDTLISTPGCILGTAAKSDPFHVRTVSADNFVEEKDRSDELLAAIRKEGIDGVVSVVGPRALGILWKLSRKGLNTVAIPKSAENDIAITMLSFGFNSTLSFVMETLDRAREATRSAGNIAVVEVLGQNAGWLALQAGMAVCADAVLIPEIPYDIKKVAAKLKERSKAGRVSGLVVVAEGAKPAAAAKPAREAEEDNKMKAALSPGASDGESAHVIERSGQAASEVTLELKRLTDQEVYPLVLAQLAKGGSPTVVDRQLGLGYGAAAVRALRDGQSGVMVVFQPPDIKRIPIQEAINKVRVILADSEFIQIARSLGICLGDQ